MDGIRLINVGSTIETLLIESARIKHSPTRAYQYEADNPIDPAQLDLIGRYHKDTFEVELLLDAGEWSELTLFLEKEGDQYLEFDHDGILQQYPVTRVTDYPECSDDQHENIDVSILRIESRYWEMLPIDFNAAISSYIFSIN